MLSSILIYSTIYLGQYKLLLNIDFYITDNPVLLYLFCAAQTVQVLAFGSSFSGSCAPLTYPHQCGIVVVALVVGVLPYFLAL